MATVKFTNHLKRFFPTLTDGITVEAATVAELLDHLDRSYPGFAAYIVDETGTLRKHVNIFLGDDLIQDRQTLSDPIRPDQRVFIFQALSGG